MKWPKQQAQMESINSLYKAQLESASRQAEINQESIENATKLKEQMESLASNLIFFKWSVWWNAFCNEQKLISFII